MKYKVTLSIGYAGCTVEDVLDIDDEDLEGLSEGALKEYLDMCWTDWSSNYIDGSISEC